VEEEKKYAVAVVCKCGRTVKFKHPLKMSYEDVAPCLSCGTNYLPCYVGATDTPVVLKKGSYVDFTGEVIYE